MVAKTANQNLCFSARLPYVLSLDKVRPLDRIRWLCRKHEDIESMQPRDQHSVEMHDILTHVYDKPILTSLQSLVPLNSLV